MTGLNIALIGYGKMGRTIHELAEKRGHNVQMIIDIDQKHGIEDLDKSIDVAIEFTRPEAAYDNIMACLKKSIPVVVGTTGWLDKYDSIKSQCQLKQGAFFYASNYSIGVNVIFKLNQYLAQMMNHFPEYEIEIEEIHHIQKLDSPSGTAITLAEGILAEIKHKKNWVNRSPVTVNELPILSKRIPDVPGTHTITYHSEVDDIEIKHTAHSRKGFATGAVIAAEWLKGKTGCFGMSDLLKF
jgi:4-hydroxy-tetrahydrodipicolinate reductase